MKSRRALKPGYSIKSVILLNFIIIFFVIIIANLIDFQNFAFWVTYIVVFNETKIFGTIAVSYCYKFLFYETARGFHTESSS